MTSRKNKRKDGSPIGKEPVCTDRGRDQGITYTSFGNPQQSHDDKNKNTRKENNQDYFTNDSSANIQLFLELFQQFITVSPCSFALFLFVFQVHQ